MVWGEWGAVYLRLALGISVLGVSALFFRQSFDLRRARVLLVLTLALGFLPSPRAKVGPIPSAQLWSAPTMKLARAEVSTSVLTVGRASYSIPLPPVHRICWALFLAGVFFWIFRFFRSLSVLRRLRNESPLLRRRGQVEIRVSETELVPLSFRLPGVAVVLVPSYLLEQPQDLSLAIRHELQHHRQGDTRWLYLFESLKSIFFWNPAAAHFSRWMAEIQEFACDEALVNRRRVSAQAYGGCLLKVAEMVRTSRGRGVGTACAAADSSASTLKRRIIHMLNAHEKKRGRGLAAWLGTLGCFTVVVTGWATQFGVQDRRISIDQAEQLAVVAMKGTDFPITINEPVLKALNLYAGTPDGREFVQAALARMEIYKPMIQQKLAEYRLPEELMAMPIMESGYQNLPEHPRPLYSAGVWQFIPQTARNYGLRVDKKIDERLHVDKETDAASRYLGSLFYRFRDWELAILAYNAGENRVQKGITETGSRNAWKLIDEGYGGDKGYLPKMVAAILLMKSPSLLQ